MSVTIGRASLNDLYGLQVRGRRVSFTTDIEGTDQYGLQALRQQLAGLVDNRDEEVVPFTWSEDATLDGFYRVVSVDIPSTEVQLTNGWIPGVRVELEQVPGFSNPWFEVTTQAVVRTNGHGITAPLALVVSYTTPPSGQVEVDRRPTLSGLSSSAFYRTTSSGDQVQVGLYTAPVAAASYSYCAFASSFLDGACQVEVKYGSTWYPVVGREVPMNTVWRLSNGIVRLTSAIGANAGTFEVWDNAAAAWESKNVQHWENGSASEHIGIGYGSTTSSVSILRNAPEQCTVKCAYLDFDVTYSIQRGAGLVSASWTSKASRKFGIGLASPTAAGTAFTGGVRATSNDANGNRMAFGTAAANSNDLAATATWYTSSATAGSMWVGVELDGATGTGGTTAAELRDQFLGAVSWRQRIVAR